MLIQFHFLQNYSPSNLNRDQSGSPKDAMFGSYKRGRISSQCLKRNIRRSDVFMEAFAGDGLLGMRTQQLPALVREKLVELATTDEITAIITRVPEIGRESTKGKKDDDADEETEVDDKPEEINAGETKQLIFLDTAYELPQLARKLLEQCRKYGVKDFANPKKVKISEITKALGQSVPRSVDIALFGRMTTSDAFKNIQAASQVAHALSTHTVEQEFDYYTAMDDHPSAVGKVGADMIGDIEFNSCTYYKYINVHWEGLIENLGGKEHQDVARRAVLALLNAAAIAQPSGKQNSFAAFNLPDFILVEVSEKNLPVSYANAFLKPARAYATKTLMDVSLEQLDQHVQRLSKIYSLKPGRAFLALNEQKFMAMKSQESLDELAQWLQQQLPK